MKDKQTQKENLKKEAENKLELLRIHQTLLEGDLSLSAKEDLMNLFRSVGSYLKDTYRRIYLTLHYINHKIKKNATKS